MRWGRLQMCSSALVCGAFLVACADAVGPSIGVIDELFVELDNTWTVSTNPVSVSPGVAHLTTRPAAAACGYSAATERFVCPSRVLGGITSATSFQLLDAGSTPQASVSDATASVRFLTDVSGVLPSNGSTSTAITAHADAILSGLVSGIHTLNGTQTSTFVNTGGPSIGTYSMVETTSNLVLATSDHASPYPSSGSITTLIFSGLPGAGAPLSTVTSTFNGTHKVTLVISTGGATQTCTIDLTGAAPICG